MRNQTCVPLNRNSHKEEEEVDEVVEILSLALFGRESCKLLRTASLQKKLMQRRT